MVECPSRLLLVTEDAGKGLLGHPAVLELAEHELVVPGQQRAAGVTVVLGRQRLLVDEREEVVDEDGGLGSDGGGSLAVGKAGCVAEGKYIGVSSISYG